MLVITKKRGKRERRVYRVINEMMGYYNIMDQGRLDKTGNVVIDQLYGARSSIKITDVEPYQT